MGNPGYELPDGLPVPTDDGRCDHVTGMELPAIALPSTGGGTVDLSIQAIMAPIRTSRRGMSAFGGKADVNHCVGECPLIAISGHSDSTWPFTPLDVESSRR